MYSLDPPNQYRTFVMTEEDKFVITKDLVSKEEYRTFIEKYTEYNRFIPEAWDIKYVLGKGYKNIWTYMKLCLYECANLKQIGVLILRDKH